MTRPHFHTIDVRSRDELIRDGYAIPDGSLDDGQYVIELDNGRALLHAFTPKRGAIDHGDRGPKYEDTSAAKWWRFLAGNRD